MSSTRFSTTSTSNRHLPGNRRAEYTDPSPLRFNSTRYNRRPGDPLDQNKSTCEITLQSNETLTRCCLRFCCITANPGTIPSNSSKHFNSDTRPLSPTALCFAYPRCVFRSGFVWKIIENKWSRFEAAFHQYVASPPERYRRARGLDPKIEIRPGRIANHLLEETYHATDGSVVAQRPLSYKP